MPTGKFPNELVLTTTLANTDLLITQKDGESTVKKFTYDDLKTNLGYESVIINVGANGDFTTVTAALNAITDNTPTKRYTVLVTPGVYSEANPTTGKAYVSVVAIGGKGSVRLNALNAGNFFIGAQNFNFSGITFGNVTGGYAIHWTGVGGMSVQNCNLLSSEGFNVNGVSAGMSITNLTMVGVNGVGATLADGTLNITGMDVPVGTTASTLVLISGGSAVLSGITALGATVTTGVDIDGANVTIRGLDIDGAVDGLVVKGTTSHVSVGGAHILNCTQDGVRVSAGDVDIVGIHIEGSTRWDANFDGDATILGSAIVSFDNIFIDPATEFIGTAISSKVGDSGMTVIGELNVGLPDAPFESVFGQGDSYTRGMLVYTETSGGLFVDVSTAAASGSTFTFPGIAADNAIYTASSLGNGTFLQYYGLKTSIDTAVVLGGGEIVLEYWAGGPTWVEANFMVTESSGKYLPSAKQIFEGTGSYQVRFDAKMPDDWVAHDPMTLGTSYFWTRWRIKTAITTVPAIEQFKQHSSRLEANADGYLTFFGTARPAQRFPFFINMLKAAASSPSVQDLYLSDFLDVGHDENKFLNNTTDRIAFSYPLPATIDTSTDITFAWALITDDATAGNIFFKVRWSWSDPTANVYRSQADAPATSTNEELLDYIVAAPTVADTLQWYSQDLDLSNALGRRDGGFPDMFWLSLERVGADALDTHSGDISLAGITAAFLVWNTGSHL